MKFEIHIAEKRSMVEVQRDSRGELQFLVDGRAVSADALKIGADAYSILLESRSFDVRVQPVEQGLVVICGGQEYRVGVRDPRAWRRRDNLLVAQGRQQVTAAMPGKVVRVLIAAGQDVEAGQGLAVVEAMKMQNEIRSPKSGTVERVFVTENQTIAVGQPIASIA